MTRKHPQRLRLLADGSDTGLHNCNAGKTGTVARGGAIAVDPERFAPHSHHGGEQPTLSVEVHPVSVVAPLQSDIGHPGARNNRIRRFNLSQPTDAVGHPQTAGPRLRTAARACPKHDPLRRETRESRKA
jgi:hypothetical protein